MEQSLAAKNVKIYVYFVAYSYHHGTSRPGINANTSISRQEPITSYDDILELQASLKCKHAAYEVVVLNWQLLRMDEAGIIGSDDISNTAATTQKPFKVVRSDNQPIFTNIQSLTEAHALASKTTENESGESFFVTNAHGTRVAGYVNPDSRFDITESFLDEVPNSKEELEVVPVDNLITGWSAGSEEELLTMLRNHAEHAKDFETDGIIVRFQEFKLDTNNRMLDMNPKYTFAFYRFDNKFVIGDNLPLAIQAALKKFEA